MAIQFYLQFIKEALLAANDAVAEATKMGTAGRPLGKGSFGDVTYAIDSAVEERVLRLAAARLPPVKVISE